MSVKHIFLILLGSLPWIVHADALREGHELFRQGDYHAAARIWERALAKQDISAAQKIEIELRLARIYQINGHHDLATQLSDQAWERAEDVDTRLRILSRRIESRLANQKSLEARTLLEQQLIPLLEQCRDAEVRALALNIQGHVLKFFENHAEALAAYQAAATEAKGDALTRARILTNVADTAFLLKRPHFALETLQKAWALLQKHPPDHDRLGEGVALARSALRLPWPSSLELAAEIFETLRHDLDLSKDTRLHAYFHGYLARLYEQAGRHAEALRLTDKARFLSQNDSGLDYVWLWQRGRLLQAQGNIQASADHYREALALLQPIRDELLNGRRDARRVFREDIRPVYYALIDVLLRQAKRTKIETLKQRLLEEARAVLETMKAEELRDYFQDECVARFKHRIGDRSKSLPPDAAILYPILLSERTELLLQLPDGPRRAGVPVPGKKVEKLARKLQRQLQTRTRWNFIEPARTLYAVLIQPVRDMLKQRKINTLIFVPDGALRMIPPAALHSGEDYLNAEFALAVTPGLEVTDIEPLVRQHLSALVLGLSEGTQGFSPLPAVKREISHVSDFYRDNAVLFNQDFNLRKISQNLMERPFQIVHVASHGKFERDPEKSFILTYDTRLTLNKLEELLNLRRYQGRKVELLTLSACQSAVGDERAALGLAGVAVKSGARGALASLWYVSDEATTELIVEFYRRLRNPQTSKAQALRNAQRTLIADRRFSHPAYWAPFLLIGNWL